ncbi:MAG TPA: carboxylate-amine ligase [Anaerolineales bacterium]|nr:carboxylate-amine ligase [Anaerolineales bacterium]
MYYDVPLTLGIEEEYQIVDPSDRNLHSYIQKFLEKGKHVLPEGQLKPEFMQSQVEVGSQVCRNASEVRTELKRLRGSVNQIARENNLRIVAASTHPFAVWSEQSVTDAERYYKLLDNLRGVAQQLLIFGMHIHVGFGDAPHQKELLIEVMNQLRYFLPHLLALSTSSPFWQSKDTGLKSYRSVIFEMLPRTGIPQNFRSWSEYMEFIQLLNKVGSFGAKSKSIDVAVDATQLWWDVRPHPRFNTLEVRICDICTNLEDAVCISALLQAIVAKLLKLRRYNQSWRNYRRHHINENKWRALRFGIDGKLIDFGISDEVPFHQLGMELLEFVDDVVDELQSRNEVNHLRVILNRGTSADRQLRVFRSAIEAGASETEACHAVMDWLIDETVANVN